MVGRAVVGCAAVGGAAVGCAVGCGLSCHCSPAARAGALAHALPVALAVHPLARELVAVLVAGGAVAARPIVAPFAVVQVGAARRARQQSRHQAHPVPRAAHPRANVRVAVRVDHAATPMDGARLDLAFEDRAVGQHAPADAVPLPRAPHA